MCSTNASATILTQHAVVLTSVTNLKLPVMPITITIPSSTPQTEPVHQQVPFDAPDVALGGQRLLAYEKRSRWDEARAVGQEVDHTPPAARPRQPDPGQQPPNVAEGGHPAPPQAVHVDEKVIHPRQQWDLDLLRAKE